MPTNSSQEPWTQLAAVGYDLAIMSTGNPAESFASQRLIMRPWRPTDELAYHAIFGDRRVVWWAASPQSLKASRASLQRAIARQNQPQAGMGRFAVVCKKSQDIIGNLMLCPAGFAEGIEVGYHFAPQHWGCGYATEAARAGLARGFEELELSEIVAAVALTNGASLAVVEKLGMIADYDAEHAGLSHRMFIIRKQDWPGSVSRALSSTE